MNNLLKAAIATSVSTLSIIAMAASSQSGTISVEVPVTATITSINNADLDFGQLNQSNLQTAHTATTNVSVYSNASTAQDLCLTAHYNKFDANKNMPYLSPSDSELTPIFLQNITYRACGGAGSASYNINGSQTAHTTLTAGNGGTTEQECIGTSGTPGLLSITTEALSAGATPRVGGTYTSTIQLGVGAGGC